MFLLDWYQQFLRIRREAQGLKINLDREVKEVEVCQSCETLKEQLALANAREQKLLDRIMEKPETKEVELPKMVTMPSLGRHTPWKVRQQLLQNEDRERAKLMKEAPKSDNPTKADVAELEKELDIAAEERGEVANRG